MFPGHQCAQVVHDTAVEKRSLFLTAAAILVALTSVNCPLVSGGLPSCGDKQAVDLVIQLFNENTDYNAIGIDFVTMTDFSVATGYQCQGQMVDNDGDKWMIDYSIRKNATEPTEFVVAAEWRFIVD